MLTIGLMIVIIFNLSNLSKSLPSEVVKENMDVIRMDKAIANSEDIEASMEADMNSPTYEDHGETISIIFDYDSLPDHIISRMENVSWKVSSPVQLKDLSYLQVAYWGFDDTIKQGELVVHKLIAKEVLEIFKELYEAKFPIEKINLIDHYGAEDESSMADNNTSSYCFREVLGQPGSISKHSYGLAIDINPAQNPYVKGNAILPKEGSNYLDRDNIRKGMIVIDDPCHGAFKSKGWTWGGDWKTMKDYQHFEKTIVLE